MNRKIAFSLVLLLAGMTMAVAQKNSADLSILGETVKVVSGDGRLTMLDPAAVPNGAAVEVAWFDERPAPEVVERAMYDGMVVSLPSGDGPVETPCDDSTDCASAIRETCEALGSKVRRQVFDIAIGCSGVCVNGRQPRVTCVEGEG